MIPRVLVIGAESDARDRVCAALRLQGWRLRTVPPGGAALHALGELMPHAIVMFLPEGPRGQAYLKHLRLADFAGPLLLLGDRNTAPVAQDSPLRFVLPASAPTRVLVAAIRGVLEMPNGRTKRPLALVHSASRPTTSGTENLLAFRRS